MKPSSTRISAVAARLTMAAVALHQAMLFGVILARPDLDPAWRTLSEYALGQGGWLMSATFLVGAVCHGALWATLRSQVPGAWGKGGLAILLVCAAGTAAAGLFTTDPFDTVELSARGTVHLVSAFGALTLFPVAALLINLGLARRNPDWVAARGALRWTAFLPLAGLAAFWTHLSIYVLPLGEHAHGPGVPLGWPPRLLLLVYAAWSITMSVQALIVRGRAVASVNALAWRTGPGMPFPAPTHRTGFEGAP